MSIFFPEIQEYLCNRNQLIELCTDSTEDNFDVGYINIFNKSILCLDLLDRFGQEDGVGVFTTDSIDKICIDTKYLQGIAHLARNQTPKNLVNFMFDSNDKMSDILKKCVEKKIIIRIWMDNYDYSYSGIVSKVTDNLFSIYEVDEYGKTSGLTILETGHIGAIYMFDNKLTKLSAIGKLEQESYPES